MLRRLTGAVSGGLIRSLSTAAARPPWALLHLSQMDKSGAPAAPGATFHPDYPPFVSSLTVPAQFVNPRPPLGPDTIGFVSCDVRATSGDGLLLVRFCDCRCCVPTAAAGQHGLRNWSLAGMDLDPEMTRFVCNPLSGELYRLPDLDGTKRTARYHWFGLLTQPESEGAQGPPARYVVAQIDEDSEGEEGRWLMRRFLSETGKWDKLVDLPSPVPAGRKMHVDQEVVAFGDRLWWADVSWGAISVDPFSDRPELRFVELPKGSVLPDLDGVVLMRRVNMHRRIGVSEGKLRYVEVCKDKEFVIRSFSLDDEHNSWTLEHEVPFNQIWEAERHQLVPLDEIPSIGAIDPLNANFLYIMVGKEILSIDMLKKKVIDKSSVGLAHDLLPCVLPPWLESTQIPTGTHWTKRAKVKSKATSDSEMSVHVDIELKK